jgi:hypothetical protein
MSLNNSADRPLDGPLPLNWKDEADFRGTFSILLSCLSTLVFCVWGALHEDISRRNKTEALLHRMYWVMFSIFVPELLVVTAFRQWRSASWLIRENNGRTKPNKRSSNDIEVSFD